MATEMEFVNYKEFVAGLSTTENPTFADKIVISNETDGPRAVPASESALTDFATEEDLKAGNFIRMQTPDGFLKLPADTIPADKIVVGLNLINKDALSDLGEWCNYTNGRIESTQYVTTYRHTPYIEVKPSTYYSKRYNTGSAGTSFFDVNLQFISGVQTDIFQTPANCRYVIVNINTSIESVNAALLEEGNKTINYSPSVYPTPKYYNDFKYPNPAYEEVIINRGEASVATINALTFKYDGWKFFVTDSGTLTAGSVSVVAGDSVVWRSASGKWEKINEFVSVIEKNKIIARIPVFTTGANLINKEALSDLGEWCNYTNGKIESNSYVTAYRHTPYIEVKPSTYYSKRYNTGSAGTSFFDSDMKFISGVQTDIFQTPANCQYVIVNINTGIESVNAALLEEGNKTINYSQSVYPTPRYYNDFKYPNPAYSEKDFVTVGASDSDFTTVKEAFSYAVANDKYVIIKPGVYDLVQEGISGNGYILPKKVIGYGAKLVCHLDSENWNLSPLNTDYRYEGFEVYGLTIECSNCRYCIHDEMGARTSGAYHNVFKDLHLIHKSAASETLIAPNNIGGGFGDCGYIEIINCVFEAAYTKNIDYHSSFTESQNNDGTIQCRGCKFNKTFTMTSIGSSESFNNILYLSNCLFGTNVPQSEKGRNVEIHSWNNVLQGS